MYSGDRKNLLTLSGHNTLDQTKSFIYTRGYQIVASGSHLASKHISNGSQIWFQVALYIYGSAKLEYAYMLEGW